MKSYLFFSKCVRVFDAEHDGRCFEKIFLFLNLHQKNRKTIYAFENIGNHGKNVNKILIVNLFFKMRVFFMSNTMHFPTS